VAAEALNAAIEEAVPAHVLSAALYARFRSRQQATYADKLLSAGAGRASADPGR
jgi:6-phosphogluconate dehydrogenase (decarboxylating)